MIKNVAKNTIVEFMKPYNTKRLARFQRKNRRCEKDASRLQLILGNCEPDWALKKAITSLKAIRQEDLVIRSG